VLVHGRIWRYSASILLQGKKKPKMGAFDKQTAHSAFQNTHKNRGKISLDNIPLGYATKIAIA
jgi:hypothetical protein